MNEDKILQKLDSIDEHLAEHDRCFDAHDNQFDLIARTLVNHEERLIRIEENMATKDDIHGLSGTVDKILKLVIKKDEELTMVTHGMRRVQDDIDRIKPLVGLA